MHFNIFQASIFTERSLGITYKSLAFVRLCWVRLGYRLHLVGCLTLGYATLGSATMGSATLGRATVGCATLGNVVRLCWVRLV